MNESLIVPLASIIEPLPLAKLFPVERPVEVELGAGDGSFLAAYARAHPDRNFIGVERLLGRLRKIDRKGRRAGLDNLRLFRIEADYITRYLLPKGSVSAIHIYFPDPWPKRRHWKNRLIQESFVNALLPALQPGGHAYVRTDDRPYFDQMLASFAAAPGFQRVDTPPDLLGFITDFERGFQARGISTCHASYRKIS